MSPLIRHGALVLCLAGAGLVLAAGSQDWATVALGAGFPTATLTGGQVSAAAVPVALAVAAGAVVSAFGGRWVRTLVAVGSVVAGVLLAVTLLGVLRDEAELIDLAWRQTVGVEGSAGAPTGDEQTPGTPDSVTVSGWAWAAVAGTVTIAAGGLTGLDRRRTSSRPSARYDRTVGSGRPGGTGRPSDPGPSDPAGRERPVDQVRAWDALSRGEDPTS